MVLGIGLNELLQVTWSHLISSREKRYFVVTSLHLCATSAVIEIATEHDMYITVYIHGSCFCFPSSTEDTHSSKLFPHVARDTNLVKEPRAEEILLAPVS